jgi:DinB family protein
MTIEWNPLLLDQLVWYWDNLLRPRLDGLTDEEYFWEPAPGAWNVRLCESGEFVIDFEYPEPVPPPVTTIAWRLGHIIVGVFGMRNADHFGGPPVDYESFPFAGTAKEALRQLDEAYTRWVAGSRSLGEDGLARPCGPAEGPYADLPLAALLLHIHREVIHHGAEVSLLRDLYRARG